MMAMGIRKIARPVLRPAVALAAMAVCAVVVATASASAAAPRSASITVAVAGEPALLDPHKLSDATQNAVLWEVYEALTYIESGAVKPLLAASLPQHLGPRRWVVKLKRGVRFSDGTPFNADSVLYSLTRIKSAALATSVPEAATLDRAEKIDDYTVRIYTHRPDALFGNKLAAIKMMKPGQGDNLSGPVGTGPYRMESYTPGREAVLVANPRYHGKRPQVTRVTVKFIPDPSTRLKALQAGELDLLTGLPPDQMGSVPKVLTSKAYLFTYWLRINTFHKPLDDVRVRQAINYAIDKVAITTRLYPKGIAVPANCVVGPPRTGNANDKIKPYPYNPTRARQLIDAAGAQGASLTLPWTSGVFPYDREVGQLVAQQLNAIGLNVTLRFQDNASMQKEVATKGAAAPDFNAAAGVDALGNIQRLIDNFYPSFGGGSTVSDPKLDALVKKAGALSFGPKRQKAFDELIKYGCDQAVMGFLYSYKDVYGASKRINYEPIAPSLRPNWSLVTVNS